MVHNYGCDILWENEFCVIYICIYMKCLCRWNAKNKKKISASLPRAMTKALSKEESFAEGPSNSPRQRFFWEKSWKFLCLGPGSRPSAKVFKKIQKKLFLCRGPALSKQFFFKKKPLPRALAIALGKVFFGKILKISLPRAREEALGKGFWKKIKKIICRGSALGKQIKKTIFLPRVGPTAPASDGFFSLPRAVLALDKGFAECPIKGPQ